MLCRYCLPCLRRLKSPLSLPPFKRKLSISLSSTLNALKDLVGSDSTLGPIRRDQQRLFYLGRELKSGNRSLSALGIGYHGVYAIHLLSSAPKVVDLQSLDVEDSGKSAGSLESRHSDVAESVSRSTGGGNVMRPDGRQRQREREKVVELLDSDSDDDDDVEIIETSSKRIRGS